jgi:protoporphyrinogen oxidase
VTDLLVLGGGPAGVGAAYRAAWAGHAVTLLERAPVPGGAAGSFEVAGLRVDHGSHRLHPATPPDVLADLRRLLGEDLQRRLRRGRIRLAGRWVAFPLSARDLLTSLPTSFAAGAARDAALSWTRRPRADTFAEVLRAGLGPTLCERFYFPYARKLWGLEPDELSGEQARRRVRADSPAKLVARVLGGGADPDRGVFHYPRTGFGAISERLASAAAQAGADLRFSTTATGLVLTRGGAGVVADGRVYEARRVFSTIPLTVLAGLVEPPVPAAVRAAAGALRFRAMTLVYLVLGTRRYTPFDAHYLPEAFTPVTRVSEPRNYRDGDDPEDRTVLCAEVPCEVGDGVWTADQETLGALVADGLRAAGLPDPPVTDVTVRRLSRAYPVYRVGFERHFATLDAWASAQPNLLTFGRQGLFAHDNTHHALAMAWAATAALRPDGSFDDAAWATARRRFAEHVVED